MSEASGGATAMDTLERKFAIPEKSGDAGEADSPEQSGVQTPKHEYQSGFKRLRPTGWEEVEGSEHGTGSGEDDELPGTSVGSIEATADEVRYLQNRTKSACSQLADIIVDAGEDRKAQEKETAKIGDLLERITTQLEDAKTTDKDEMASALVHGKEQIFEIEELKVRLAERQVQVQEEFESSYPELAATAQTAIKENEADRLRWETAARAK